MNKISKKSPIIMIAMALSLTLGLALFSSVGTALAWDISPYDTDGDGQLSEAELTASGRGYPWNEDANGDGYYSQEEIDAAEALSEIKLADGQNGEGPHLTNLDSNNDGKLSWEEFQVGFPNVQTNPDTNGDGHIELAELEAIAGARPSGDTSNGPLGQQGPLGQTGGQQLGDQQGQLAEQPNQNSGPGGQGPDLAATAATLGITEQALRDALGTPPPDLAAAASALGLTEQALTDAIGLPAGGPFGQRAGPQGQQQGTRPQP